MITHVLYEKIFSKNINESDKFCGNFFAKFLINFVSTNVILDKNILKVCFEQFTGKKHTLRGHP